MSRLVVNENLSLDGVMQSPAGPDEDPRGGFQHGDKTNQVADKVRGYVDAGCAEFVLWFRDYPSTESLERFMQEVVPLVEG